MNDTTAIRQLNRTAAWRRHFQCLPITPHA
jgi:hypothetical protein